MISNPQVKEETKNLFMKIVINRAKRYAKFNEYTDNLFVCGFYFSLLCFLTSYLKMIGNAVSGVKFEGLSESLSSKIFSIFNLVDFLLDKPPIIEILIIALLCKNIFYIFLLVFIFIFQKAPNWIENTYQIIYYITYWMTISLEIEFWFYVNFGEFHKNESNRLFYEIVTYINLVTSLFASIKYSFFINKAEFNVDNEDFLSRIDSNNEFVFLFLKIFFSIIYSVKTFLVNDLNITLYIGLLFLIHIIFILYSLKFSFYYHFSTQIIVHYFNLSLCYTIIVAFVIQNEMISDQDLILLCGYISLLPISFYLQNYLIEYYLTQTFSQITDGVEITRYMAYFMLLGSDKNLNSNRRILLYGAVSLHEKFCLYSDCTCKLPVNAKLYLPNLKVMYNIEDDYKKEYNYIYIIHLIKSLYEYAFHVEKTVNPNLHLMYCFFMNFYVGNFFYSLYFALNLRKNDDLTIQQRVSLERLLEIINKVLEFNFNKIEKSYNINNIGADIARLKHKDMEENKSVSKSTKKQTDINKKSKNTNQVKQVDFHEIINFYKKINDVKHTMKQSLEASMKFWNAILLKENISLIKKFGLEFSDYNNLLLEDYEKLLFISNSHKEINTSFQLYNTFLFGQTQMITVNNANTKILKHSNIEKYFEKNSAFVVANIIDKDKPIIEKISEKIINFLGYVPTECLGQDVKMLMPNFYKIRHTRFLLNHFKTGINKILNMERVVFTQHILSYSIPTNIVIKLSSSINNISYIGFIKEININYEFLVLTKQGQIMFYSKNIYENIIKNLRKFDFTNNFIHFYCKEYIGELEYINDPNYEFSDFSLNDPKCEQFGYYLLHFGINKAVVDYFKEEKKINRDFSNYRKQNRKKSDNNNRTQGNTPMMDYDNYERENLNQQPILHVHNPDNIIKSPFDILVSKADQIKKEIMLRVDTEFCLKYFARKNSIKLCEGEEYFILKLYSSLNLDRSIFDEEINEMEKHLIEKEIKEVEKLQKKYRDSNNNFNNEDATIISKDPQGKSFKENKSINIYNNSNIIKIQSNNNFSQASNENDKNYNKSVNNNVRKGTMDNHENNNNYFYSQPKEPLKNTHFKNYIENFKIKSDFENKETKTFRTKSYKDSPNIEKEKKEEEGGLNILSNNNILNSSKEARDSSNPLNYLINNNNSNNNFTLYNNTNNNSNLLRKSTQNNISRENNLREMYFLQKTQNKLMNDEEENKDTYFNKSALDLQDNFTANRFNAEALNLNSNNDKSTIDKEIWKSIMSTAKSEKLSNDNYIILKKKFLKRNNSSATYISIFMNFIFYSLIVGLLIYTYDGIFLRRIEYTDNFNFKYLRILDMLEDLIKIKVEYDKIEFYDDLNENLFIGSNKNNNLRSLIENDCWYCSDQDNKTQYMNDDRNKTNNNYINPITTRLLQNQYTAQEIKEFINSFISQSKLNIQYSKNRLNVSTLDVLMFNKDYFDDLLEYLNENLVMEVFDISYNLTLRQYMNLLYTHFNYQESLDFNLTKLKNESKYEYEILKVSRNFSLLLEYKEKIYSALDNKFDRLNSKKASRNTIYYVIIGALSLLSLITLVRIINLYQIQNKRISLLLSLDERIPKELIKGIRRVIKMISQRMQQDVENNDAEDNNDNDEKDLLKEDGNGIEISLKLAKRNKSYIWEVNWEIYVQVIVILVLITVISLIPILYRTNDVYYEDKFTNILTLLKISKINQYNLLLLYSNFFSIITSRNDTERNEHIKTYSSLLDSNLNSVEFQSSKVIYDVVEGLNNTEDFITFYSKEVCVYSNNIFIEDSLYLDRFNEQDLNNENRVKYYNNYPYYICNENEKIMYDLKGYKYLEDLFYSLIDDYIKSNIVSNWENDSNLKEYLSLSSSEMSSSYYSLYLALMQKDVEYLSNIFEFLYEYAYPQYNYYFINTVQLFLVIYRSTFIAIFVSSIILIFLYMMINTFLINYYNLSVNVEIKKLFSLLPNVVIYNNEGIFKLFKSA